jgi:Leucine-rich repeat (LRR) protein
MHWLRITSLLIVLISNFYFPSYGYYFSRECPNYCTCDLNLYNLTIQCSQPQVRDIFLLPTFGSNQALARTETLILRNTYVKSVPINLCSYEALTYLDLSSNFINEQINLNTFNCLRKLKYLNISNNLISDLDASSFDFLNDLEILDLRNNRLKAIPSDLFYFKLPNLTHL